MLSEELFIVSRMLILLSFAFWIGSVASYIVVLTNREPGVPLCRPFQGSSHLFFQPNKLNVAGRTARIIYFVCVPMTVITFLLGFLIWGRMP